LSNMRATTLASYTGNEFIKSLLNSITN